MAYVDIDVLVIAADENKEDVIEAALPHMRGNPKLIVAGYGHLTFRDEAFNAGLNSALVPSIANGYPNSLIHLYQCLANAARLRLDGSVVEFGTFKGGTTMLLAKWSQALGQHWPVVTFDTFGGFPARKSPLDMYDHPGAVFQDEQAVRTYFRDWPIELVVGDICETAQQLGDRPIVLAFIDTDNYSSAVAAVNAIADTIAVGGAIVFDHYTGVDRFRYTLGERVAAKTLLADERYFCLHGTGVFIRQA